MNGTSHAAASARGASLRVKLNSTFRGQRVCATSPRVRQVRARVTVADASVGDIREQAGRRGTQSHLDSAVCKFCFCCVTLRNFPEKYSPSKVLIGFYFFVHVTHFKFLFATSPAAPVEKSNLFNAKYVPFSAESKGEEYSLDEVIYRSQNGG